MDIKFTLIIPCYNEQEVLPIAYDRFEKAMDKLGEQYEMIFINDGSEDNTLAILKQYAKTNEYVKVISFSRNFGHQEAVTAGMRAASGEALIIIDADLQDPPELIGEMVEKWEEGFDIVFGQREKREGEAAFKRISAWGYYRFLRVMGVKEIPPDAGDFRLIDRRVSDIINQMPERNRFLRGMSAWAGFKQTSAKFVREQRAAGETKYTLKRMFKLAGDGITSFTNRPLKIAIFFGMAAGTLSFVYLLVSIILTSLKIMSITHVIFSLVFIMLSGVFVAVGILGSYIGRILDEVRGRPAYIIREKINLK
jgi:polyisoprenyl-phosphate glycosyltransferase